MLKYYLNVSTLDNNFYFSALKLNSINTNYNVLFIYNK